MPGASAQLIKIDISATHPEAMARFYEAVLGVTFTEIQVGEFTLFRGTLAGGMVLAIAPRELTGALSDRNRFQLNFQVSDVEQAFQSALTSGGKELEPVVQNGETWSASVWDPDGNSVVLVQPT